MKYLGDFPIDATIFVPFTTHAKTGGAVDPSDAFEASDVKIFKNGSIVEKATTNGITITTSFDSITGQHLLSIDTSDDTGDVGFWAAGNDYFVVLTPDSETIDGETVAAGLAHFSIANRSDATSISRIENEVTASRMAVLSDWINDGRLDVLLDAVKAKTDEMAFTVAGQLDVHVISMADNSMTADAAANDFIGAAEIAAGASQEIADLISQDWIAGDGSPLAVVAALKADAEWSNLANLAAAVAALPTAGQIADQVFEEAAADHTTAGSFGKSINDILGDTDELQGNQGNWLTATGFSTHAPVDIWNVLAASVAVVDSIGVLFKTDIAQIKNDLPARPTKNTAVNNFSFPMVLSSDHATLAPGLAVTAERSIDGNDFAACANAATEIGATGVYKIDLAASDLNGDVVILRFSAATADTRHITMLTQP